MRASLEGMTAGLAPCLQQVMTLGTLIAPAPVSCRNPPFDATCAAHDAGDVLADALFENGLPRHQLETDAVIDHSEATARELGDAKCSPLRAGTIVDTYTGEKMIPFVGTPSTAQRVIVAFKIENAPAPAKIGNP